MVEKKRNEEAGAEEGRRPPSRRRRPRKPRASRPARRRSPRPPAPAKKEGVARRARAASGAAARGRRGHAPRGVGIHDLRPAPGVDALPQARRPRAGQRTRQDRGTRQQGAEVPIRLPAPARLRGRPDAAPPPGAEARLHEHLPRRVRHREPVRPRPLRGRSRPSRPRRSPRRRLARKSRPVKILGDGEIGKALTVSAHKFSASAQAKIEAAGGRCEVTPALNALQSFANIFSVPDLRKRIMFTFLLLAVYRLGAHIPTPGVDPMAHQRVLPGVRGLAARLPRHLLGRRAAAALRVRARDHAVHLGVDHPAAADGRLALPREALQGRGDGAQEDHAVHALRHGAALLHPGDRHRALARETEAPGGAPLVPQSGLGLPTA